MTVMPGLGSRAMLTLMKSRSVQPAVGLLMLLAVLAPGAARAADGVIDRWYKALLAVDRPTLTELLADNAVIRLEDLGITQTKTEFITSMDEWQQAVTGADIKYRVESEDGASTTVLACYDFPDNDILMRETFVTAGGRISESIQGTVAESCAGY